MTSHHDADTLIDPDPFVVGLGLIQIIATGAGFLEARRQRQAVDRLERERFRTAWFQAKRSLIFFKRTTDEFESYVLEGGYGRREFRIGIVRLILDPNQYAAMRRMHGQCMTTANHLADNLADLSEFLGPQDQAQIDAIHERLKAIENFPPVYRDVIALSRESIQAYQDLLDDIGEREQFAEETS